MQYLTMCKIRFIREIFSKETNDKRGILQICILKEKKAFMRDILSAY